jgi:hypothetical protein
VSDKHLERKEVLNIVYTQQAERMADAYARLMSDFSQMTAWGRGLESDLSWARAELLMVKAEVERLTKAGDAMASSIQFNEEMSQDYNGPTIVHQSVQRWNAAKEGKQS